MACQQLGAVEQLAQIKDAQQPCPPKSGLVHGIRAGKGTRAGRGGLRPLRHPPRFNYDHRFKAGSGACG